MFFLHIQFFFCCTLSHCFLLLLGFIVMIIIIVWKDICKQVLHWNWISISRWLKCYPISSMLNSCLSRAYIYEYAIHRWYALSARGCVSRMCLTYTSIYSFYGIVAESDKWHEIGAPLSLTVSMRNWKAFKRAKFDVEKKIGKAHVVVFDVGLIGYGQKTSLKNWLDH